MCVCYVKFNLLGDGEICESEEEEEEEEEGEWL